MTKFESNLSEVIEELQNKDVVQDAKDVDLQNQIDSEVTARTDMDTQLQTNIDAEVSTRTAADQNLQEQITTEVSARVDGDKLLQNNIDAEAVARIDTDSQLQTNINIEVDSRKNVDQDLQEQIDVLKIPGAVQYFARQTAPEGWLKADGSAVSRTQYAHLFAALGTMFGEGDGSTTFNLPDLRGEFIRGVDNGRGVDASRALGSWQKDQLASHQHTFPAGDILDGGPALQADRISTLTASTTYVGGVETRPRNIALLACIKY
jgi:microcystin-dependent protein